MIKSAFFEFRKNYLKKLFLSLLIPTVIIFIKSFDPIMTFEFVQIFMLLFSFFIFLYFISIISTNEFFLKTSKFVYTGLNLRKEVLIKKFLIMIFANIFTFLFFTLSTTLLRIIVYNISFDMMTILKNLVVFLFLGIFISTFNLFVSYITLNAIMSIIINLLLFFPEFYQILKMIPSKNKVISTIIYNIPFDISFMGFITLKYSFNNMLILLVFSTIFIIFSLIILEKRDLK
ncbi:hypothetical protein OSSY52_08080 [Tepiditoga spiralis]|uniref:Uncharacterized protein n=1 Tax=Tepiditoga spiralis TaxID=2108365 RepID=A0A7G1G6Y3_9BACT|nr:hypothetical protein [Tepiditoga spiralis]BBE30667.1 hypothetical protein OSSY52_08080 [Tepiditoga spiralis]